MNLPSRPKIVVLGIVAKFPFPGVIWQTVHYLLGFQRLGFDTYYVEAHGVPPTKLMVGDDLDGSVAAAAFIESVMRRFGLEHRWAYYALHSDGGCYGLSLGQLQELYRSAELIINLHGATIPSAEHAATNRLVYLETDPVAVQIQLSENRKDTIDYLAPHIAFYSFGENYGRPGCLLPVSSRFHFKSTRQPVLLDLWQPSNNDRAEVFTTIGNWRQPGHDIQFNGETYYWSKHREFRKFLKLPSRVKKQPFELALSFSSAPERERETLVAKGWRLRDALEFYKNLDGYNHYIRESRGEFTVAKDQNIRLRTGWFSDRAATYLAAGRPVITQQTGFSDNYPTGEGLFAFSTLGEIVAAIEKINSDYPRHRRAALNIARKHFAHDVVLLPLLQDLGLAIPGSTSQPKILNSHLESRPQFAKRTSHRGEQIGGGVGNATDGQDEGSNLEAGLEVPLPILNSQFSILNSQFPPPRSIPRSIPHSPLSPSSAIQPSAFSLQPFVSPLPPDLLLTPIGRWPIRLSEVTVRTARALPVPAIADASPLRPATRASIIIVTHNGLLYTRLCLTSLFAANWNPADELIIVDNASSDGTVDYLRELAQLNPFVRVIFNNTNRGFAAANNQAAEIARGDALLLLNNDTLLTPGWSDALLRWLEHPDIGLVGPLTNRTCNEAQLEVTYRTFNELEQFASMRRREYHGQARDIAMLAMFCIALRRNVFNQVGPLDEQFEIGMFEDDDYARRVSAAGLRVVCAEEVFVHHFGQGSFGESPADFQKIHAKNRERFERKWGVTWQRLVQQISPEYEILRERIHDAVATKVPSGATIAVVSKGDDEILQFGSRCGWHFPQNGDGQYAGYYPADCNDAIAQLEALRTKGANYLLFPKPAFWWLDYYIDFKKHLEQRHCLALKDEDTCLLFDLGNSHD